MKRKRRYSVLTSRRRTLNLCFIWWIMCYIITILADYIVALTWAYLWASEVFAVKILIWVLCTWIWLKQIENMDLSDWSTFNPEE
jgi:hypothetical protein